MTAQSTQVYTRRGTDAAISAAVTSALAAKADLAALNDYTPTADLRRMLDAKADAAVTTALASRVSSLEAASGGARVLVLAAGAEVPAGTPAGTVIVRVGA